MKRQAPYRGRTFELYWIGQTRTGARMALLSTGGNQGKFWAKASEVVPIDPAPPAAPPVPVRRSEECRVCGRFDDDRERPPCLFCGPTCLSQVGTKPPEGGPRS
jgi:hypothetical protein